MTIRLVMVISNNVYVLNHYVLHLKLTYCMSSVLQCKKRGGKGCIFDAVELRLVSFYVSNLDSLVKL